jgi:SsrA-binding protein
VSPAAKSPDAPPLASNRKARFNYHILEQVEAGIELKGAEVKSIREGRVSIAEGFARIERGEIMLHGVHIQPYSHLGGFEIDPVRPRRLLLHRAEIDKLAGHVAQRGRTLVPLSLYARRGVIKVQLALCAGKQRGDKREALRRKTADREALRAMASARKRGPQ